MLTVTEIIENKISKGSGEMKANIFLKSTFFLNNESKYIFK